jgi:hypothetical protein
MKKIMSALTFISLGLAANAQELQTNFSEDSSFTAECPSSWKVLTESYGQSNNITFQAPKANADDTRGEAFVSVGREPLKKGVKTIQAAMAPQIGMFKKQIGANNIKENKIVNGKQIFVYTMKAKDKTLKNKMVMWVNGNYMYVCTYGTEVKNYEKYLKTIESIFASVQVLK